MTPKDKAYDGKCEDCAQTLDADDCGEATIDAVYVDAAGETSGKLYRVCTQCLAAGDPDGPGLRAVE
jgi:hypothetical protein